MLFVVLDETNKIIECQKLETPQIRDDLVHSIVETVRKLCFDYPIKSIGVGMPGMVGLDGTLHFAPNLKQGEGLNIKERLESELTIKCVVDNDATCAMRAEHILGAGKGSDNTLMVVLGTGIGGGIVLNGSIVRGHFGFAGEIGHMVIDPYGPKCPCGKSGCWERFASGSGLGRLGREAAQAGLAPRLIELAGNDAELVRGETVVIASQEGDQGALKVIEEYSYWVALGLANLVGILDVDRVLIGGGVVGSVELWIESVRQKLLQLVEGSRERPYLKVEPTKFKELSGAIGAALFAATPNS